MIQLKNKETSKCINQKKDMWFSKDRLCRPEGDAGVLAVCTCQTLRRWRFLALCLISLAWHLKNNWSSWLGNMELFFLPLRRKITTQLPVMWKTSLTLASMNLDKGLQVEGGALRIKEQRRVDEEPIYKEVEGGHQELCQEYIQWNESSFEYLLVKVIPGLQLPNPWNSLNCVWSLGLRAGEF